MESAIYFFRHKSIRRSCEGVKAGLFLVMAAMILAAALTVSSCNNKIEDEDEIEDPYPNNEIREEISSYLREAFLQWSQQASPSDVEAVMEDESSIFGEFLNNAGYKDYLIEKFGNNNELALQLFDGLNSSYSTEEDAFFCREFLGYFDTYKILASIDFNILLSISIIIDYPFMVENVFNIVMGKYANTNHSTIPENFNNTLQSALMLEGKSGLPLGAIYGSCRLSINFNTITGKVSSVYFNNYVEGNMHDNNGRSCYNNFWTRLWDAINYELKGTYADQNIDLKYFSGFYLNLNLTGYNPYKYKLIIYILVDGVWWIKPYYDRFYRVGFNTTPYLIPTDTGGRDYTSRLAAVMILPIDADVDINSYTSTKAIAIEYKEISR